jgi:hypothetical protein
MSLARFALPAAAWAAFVLWITPVAAAAPPAANAPGPAPTGKPAEVSTVGTTPAVLTTAERRKFELLERGRMARAARPGAAAKPPLGIPPELLRKSTPHETRVPATGARVRTKPIQGAREIAEREKAAAQ